MKLILDAHNHTVSSGHAYSTLLEYIDEAKKTGLELIAITEHAPMMPGSCDTVYFNNLSVIPGEIEEVKIMTGIELNILDKSGAVDMDDKTLDKLSPVIASFHSLCYKFTSPDMSDEEKKEELTEAVINIMDNERIQILGHPGDPRYPLNLERIVAKSLETGTLLEINNASLNSGSFRYGSRDYMLQILKLCRKAECPVIIGSDSHFSKTVGKFDNTIELLAETAFPEELIANTSIDYFTKLISVKRMHNVSTNRM